jgi:hypothetical protein
MKSVCAALFAATVAALPAPQSGSASSPIRFGGLALRSASPIHFGSINANGGDFWIGKDTVTYTPANVGTPQNTNYTIFSYISDRPQLSLSTTVPGGQQVYVTEGDADNCIEAGALKFTQPHSVATEGTPVYEGFTIAGSNNLKFEGKDWLACLEDGSTTAYQVFAESRYTGDKASCLGFTWQDAETNVPNAWQYQ